MLLVGIFSAAECFLMVETAWLVNRNLEYYLNIYLSTLANGKCFRLSLFAGCKMENCDAQVTVADKWQRYLSYAVKESSCWKVVYEAGS